MPLRVIKIDFRGILSWKDGKQGSREDGGDRGDGEDGGDGGDGEDGEDGEMGELRTRSVGSAYISKYELGVSS